MTGRGRPGGVRHHAGRPLACALTPGREGRGGSEVKGGRWRPSIATRSALDVGRDGPGTLRTAGPGTDRRNARHRPARQLGRVALAAPVGSPPNSAASTNLLTCRRRGPIRSCTPADGLPACPGPSDSGGTGTRPGGGVSGPFRATLKDVQKI